jgi:hypothetical protein
MFSFYFKTYSQERNSKDKSQAVFEPVMPRVLIDWESEEIQSANENNLKLIYINPQPCDSEFEYDLNDPNRSSKIFNSFERNDTIFVNYKVQAYCCDDFVGRISHEEHYENDVLFIELYKFGVDCECVCWFNFQIAIVTKGLNKKRNLVIKPRLDGSELILE